MTSPLRIPAALIFALVAMPALAQDDDSGSLDDIPHITFIGTAQADLTPDLATVTLGVVTEKPTASAATEETARKAQAIVAAARDLGIGAADIQTQSLTLTQTYDNINDANGRYVGQKPRGFEAANIVRIRIRDLARAGAIAQTLIEKGANRFDGIDFSVERPELALNRLVAEAVKNAKAQATAAAEAAGVKLGRVLQIERPGTEGASRPVAYAARAKAAPAPSMPVEAGTSNASTEIEVTWAIDAN